jgi:putative ABC transport system permease protein
VGILWQDARYGIRVLARSPGFTAIAVLTMAVGIGATTAMFSIVNGVLLRPMPFKDATRLVMVWEVEKTGHLSAVLPANYLEWRNQSTAFERMAILQGSACTLTDVDEPSQVFGASVSREFFSVLAVDPLLGRTFADEEAAQRGSKVVILSHGMWQRFFGADPALIGKTISLNGIGRTVVGVMPAGFTFPDRSELWLPNALDATSLGNRNAEVAGKLKPGVTRSRAQAEMDLIAGRLAAAHPENQGCGVRVTSLHEHLVQNVRLLLCVFQGATLLVLLVAIANVANLLLTRSALRAREMAVRLSLGAGRWRIVHQLLCESLLLALLGGVLGLLVARWGVAALGHLAAGLVLRIEASRVDGRVLGFALVVSLASGLVFGLVPALRATKADLSDSLKGGRVGQGLVNPHLGLLPHWVVIAEIATSLVLLTGAGLLIKSFALLSRVEPGFDPRNVLTVGLGRAPSRESRELIERLSSLPGVRAVGSISHVPISGGYMARSDVTVEGELPRAAGEECRVYEHVISPGYLRAMGIPLVTGRSFTDEDAEGTPPVAVVNETFVKQFLGGADPVGRRLTTRKHHAIVGVVGDVKHLGLEKENQPQVYYSCYQTGIQATNLVVRTRSHPLQMAASVREVIRSVAKDMPISSIQTMEERIDNSIMPQRFRTILVTLFSAIGLILAAVGIYGVVSYSVAQRIREFGIRAALGAQRTDISRLVLRQALWLTAAGVGLGLAGAAASTRVLKTFLFGVQPLDAVTLVTVSVILGGIVILASYLPARRAARIDPMVALRYE